MELVNVLNELVVTNDAVLTVVPALRAYEDVVENDDDVAKLELNTVIELVCDANI